MSNANTNIAGTETLPGISLRACAFQFGVGAVQSMGSTHDVAPQQDATHVHGCFYWTSAAMPHCAGFDSINTLGYIV